MPLAALPAPGGRAIDARMLACPACGAPVAARHPGRRQRCRACGHAFFGDAMAADPAPAPAGAVATAITRPAAAAAPGPAEGDPLVGTTLGRYRVERLLGRGGMGRVYEAVEPRGGRRVALKVLREDLASDPAFHKRFRREARLLGSLSHPHVVEVLEQGEDQGRLWFAMDFVRGESLRAHLGRGRPSPAEAARIAGQVASALSYAHERGIIHRDLKPENVLLDESGQVRLVDFGLSRLMAGPAPEASTRLTRTDVILGTFEYMAPEQRRGQAGIDGRADVYALGVIFYEMLTGTLPLGRFTPPSGLAPDIPPAYDEIVNRALAPVAAERLPSAAAFLEALEAAPGPGSAPAPRPHAAATEVLPRRPAHEIEEARAVLRHVELLSVLDRVAALVLLGLGLKWLSMSDLVVPVPIGRASTVVLLVGAVLLYAQGRHLGRMRAGSREGQVTASVLLLFLPPFFTALGIYGLVVMTSDRARRAFAMGKHELEGTLPVRASEPLPDPARRRPLPPPVWLRLFALASILWSIYAAFEALELLHGAPLGRAARRDALEMAIGTGLAALAALGLVVRFLRRRRAQRGVELSLWALLFLGAATGFLGYALGATRAVAALFPIP